MRCSMRATQATQATQVRAIAVALALAAVAALGGGSCGGGSDALPRGLSLARAGRTEEALVELRRAVAEAPSDAQAHAALGRLLVKLGRPGAAMRALEAAWRLGD